jgi:MoxR-like ATPase
MNQTGGSEFGPEQLLGVYQRVHAAVTATVIGQDDALQLCCVALLVQGHALLQGVPGLGKTLLVRALASALGVGFGRVQFTPDLMPSDVIGGLVYDAAKAAFEFRPGPLFTDLLLGDEINRAPAKTQAALLEAMQERQVTVAGERHALGEHFTVFATQNPIEHEGTYPLPEAELDRFLFRIDLQYPGRDEERALLAAHHARDPEPQRAAPVLDAAQLAAARAAVRQVTLRDELLDYVLALLRSTRDDPNLTVGGSPRAGLWLTRAAKAIAALSGRGFVVPEDVQRVWLPCFRHRVVLEPSAAVDGLSTDDALRQVLGRVPVPH